MKIRPVRAELFHANWRTSGQTDGHTWRRCYSNFAILRKRL